MPPGYQKTDLFISGCRFPFYYNPMGLSSELFKTNEILTIEFLKAHDTFNLPKRTTGVVADVRARRIARRDEPLSTTYRRSSGDVEAGSAWDPRNTRKEETTDPEVQKLVDEIAVL
jgi:hypothetical protein